MKKIVSKFRTVFRGSEKHIFAAMAFVLAFAIASWVIGTSYLQRNEGVTEGTFNPEVVAAEMKKALETLPVNPVTTAPAQQEKKVVTTIANPVETTSLKKVVTTKENPVETTALKKVVTTLTNPVVTTTTTTTTTTTAAMVVTTAPATQQVKKVVSTLTNPATQQQTTATQIVTSIRTSIVTWTETSIVTKKVISETSPNPVNNQKNVKNPKDHENPVKDKQVKTPTQNPVKEKVVTPTPNPVSGDQGSVSWPWKVYIPEHQGWFYAVSKTADVEALKNFNGVEYPNPGWYDVPAGIELKVESQLVFDSTLYSVLHDENQIAKLLEYNGAEEKTYKSPLKVPVGLPLNINPMDAGSVEHHYDAPMEVVVSEIQTITKSETKEIVEEKIVYLTAPATEAAILETETEVEVVTVTEASSSTTTTTTTTPTTTTTTVVTTTAAPETTCTPAPAVTERRFDGEVFDAAIKSYAHCKDVIGFAIGVAHMDGNHEELYSFNGNKLFPTNCTGKLRYLCRGNELMSTRTDVHTGKTHSPFEDVTITEGNFIARNNSTVLSAENGHHVGEKVLLSDAEYWSLSASDNVGYELVSDSMKKWYGEDDREYLTANYGRVYFGQGRYGYQTPSRLLVEAQDSAKYMFSNDKYAYMIKEWISMDNAMLDSHIANELAKSGNWSYIGYKIGWYNQQQMELLILKDVDGNIYCVVAMTMKDGNQILPRLGDAINNKSTWAEGGYTVVVDC